MNPDLEYALELLDLADFYELSENFLEFKPRKRDGFPHLPELLLDASEKNTIFVVGEGSHTQNLAANLETNFQVCNSLNELIALSLGSAGVWNVFSASDDEEKKLRFVAPIPKSVLHTSSVLFSEILERVLEAYRLTYDKIGVQYIEEE